MTSIYLGLKGRVDKVKCKVCKIRNRSLGNIKTRYQRRRWGKIKTECLRVTSDRIKRSNI